MRAGGVDNEGRGKGVQQVHCNAGFDVQQRGPLLLLPGTATDKQTYTPQVMQPTPLY